MPRFHFVCPILLGAFALVVSARAEELPVHPLLPGFTVRELPVKLPNTNNVRYGPDGRLYAICYNGQVYALSDTDGDGLEDKAELWWDKPGELTCPLGVAFGKDGALYVASRGRVSVLRDTHGAGKADASEIVASGWEDERHLGHNRADALGLAFNDAGDLFFSLGCTDFANAYLVGPDGTGKYDLHSERGTILKIPAGTKRREIVCTGIRFAVALGFSAAGDLFCTDQEGATWLPNGNPFDELLHIEPGRHYGFPPRHPKHLPNVVDEPSVWDYAPQHQSTCGFAFDESQHGGPIFGPAWWRGDAIVTGESRGKLWRTQLVKTPAGYVAQTQLFAALGMLTIDTCLSPRGDLVVCCHGGAPDWGTGPSGTGRIFVISYQAPAAPQPLFGYAGTAGETNVVFDRPLEPTDVRRLVEQAKIEVGRYVSEGDRYETIRPGYAVVKRQQETRRETLPVLSTALSADHRTLILRNAAHPQAENRAVWLSDADLAATPHGVSASWRAASGDATWEGWLPSPDLQVAREFVRPSAAHAEFFDQKFQTAGTLTLRGKFDLFYMLHPALQIEGKLDYEPAIEHVTLVLRGSGPLDIKTSGKVERVSPTELHVTVDAVAGQWVPYEITLPTGDKPGLEVAWFTAEDSRRRAFGIRHTWLPWVQPMTDSIAPATLPPEIAGGDWQRGKAVFFGQQALCSRCHQIRGDGGRIGPDLSNLVQRDYASVLKDVVDPSAAINPDHLAYVATLKGGDTLVGVLQNDTPQEVTLGLADGTTRGVPRAELASFVPSAVSLMPPGLLAGLSEQQRKDLFVFLLTAPPSAPVAGAGQNARVALESPKGPIRVLFLGNEAAGSRQHVHVLMREFGRDAVWFDYADDPKTVTPERLALFDAVIEDGATIEGVDPKRLVKVEFTGDEQTWGTTSFIDAVRVKVLAAAGEARRKEWEAFLAQREPEKREPHPQIANYEKRPEPVTFQHPFSVKGSIERTQVPADMKLKVFASEPDIMKPIAFAWDERGRLWVAETRDYPHGYNPEGIGNDDIKICEDTDGDGVADKFTVFADHLNIPTSFTFANGGIIVAQPPRFLFLKSSKGDDHADIREEILTGWGIGDTHGQAGNLHYGYDNWLYGSVGYDGFEGVVGGKNVKFTMGTYRFRPDGRALEFLHQFTNNTWGQGANQYGDQFGGTANGAPIFYGGIPAATFPAGLRGMSAKKINTEEKVHTITPNFRQVDVFGGYTAAAGSSFIYSANLPPRLQGKAMVCEPTMKVITLMDVQPDGAGYVAKDGFNLVASTDEWMSPVFAEVGPDGAVWFADWQNFIIQHNPTPSVERGGFKGETGPGAAHKNDLRDHARGRIYRVVWDKAQPVKTSVAGANASALVDALGGDTQYGRLRAQRLLVEGEHVDATPALKQIVAANDGRISAVHALWTLHGLGTLDEATVKSALSAKDGGLRRNAVRVLGHDAKASALFFSAGVIGDPDPHTRLAALVKLSEFPTTPEIQTVVKGLAHEPAIQADEWLSQASKALARRHKVEAFKEGPNLLPNPGFEELADNGLPVGWTRRDYGNKPGNAKAEWKVVSGEGMVHSGKNAVRVITRDDADTSLHADVAIKPDTQYKLSGWVKAHGVRGKVSLNDHIGRAETDKITRESDWVEVETIFNSGQKTTASINLLHVAKGDGYWDDVKLVELTPAGEEAVLAGDPKRGEQIFLHHATACILCHSLHGQGSTVGPPLDGIATRATPAYIKESLLEPNKVLAKGYESLGTSPMPPMGLMLKPQELEDIQAFLQTLK
jgi:putative membrane-bound dehydrogenase-like protein